MPSYHFSDDDNDLSESESTASNSDASTSDRAAKKRKKVSQKKQKGKKRVNSPPDSAPEPKKSKKDSSKSSKAKPDPSKADEDYKAAARAVTRCVDMFCKAGKVIETALHIADEEAAKKGELEEEELEREARQRYLQGLSPETLDRYKRAYQMLIRIAPHLKTLVNDSSKHKELRRVVSVMNKTMSTTRSDDTAHLKDKIGHYAAPNPAAAALVSPVYNGSGSRSCMGVNHPVQCTHGSAAWHPSPGKAGGGSEAGHVGT